MDINQHLAELRSTINEVSPEQAIDLIQQGAQLVDVREPDEVAQGTPKQALAISRGFLEMKAGKLLPDTQQPLVLMCGSGSRSLLAASNLQALGYSQVHSLAGGFNRWKDEGRPFAVPASISADDRARYARQMVLPEVGEAGQAKLTKAKVLLIGAGGLGSPAALYLAAAGVGTLGVIDHDTVDRSNLHRQVLHNESRVGMLKTDSARIAIKALNPSIQVKTHNTHLSADNVETIFQGYNIVVDGSDNFPTRYLVNDACVKLGIPEVYGAVERFSGQVSVFGYKGQPCYRCLFPEPPPAEKAPPCSEAGVLGIMPGLVGMMQSLEVLKIILGFGETLEGRLLLIDGKTSQFRHIKIGADSQCDYCNPSTPFPGFIDYIGFCNA